MTQRILVPVDGSKASEDILFQVERWLHRDVEDTVIELLRVVLPHRESWLDRFENLGKGEAPLQLRRQRAQEYLEDLHAKLEKQGLKVESSVEMGDPATRIIERVKDSEPELVAMATRGTKGVKGLLRGSVANRVMQRCPVPLLLLDPPTDGKLEWHFRIDRILCPLDGSRSAEKILPLIEKLAKRYDAEVVLYHASPLALDDDQSPLAKPMAICRNAGVNVRALIVDETDPVPGILKAIETEQVDLLAMSTHGFSSLDSWAFGSVAQSVLRSCHKPMLVYRVAAY